MKTIPIRYIGRKDELTDILYGTGITWRGHGDVHDVPVDRARHLLAHPDIWEDARSKAAQKKEPVIPEPPPPAYVRRPLDRDPPPINLTYADAHALRRYAQAEFNEALPEDMPVDALRSRVRDLIRMRS